MLLVLNGYLRRTHIYMSIALKEKNDYYIYICLMLLLTIAVSDEEVKEGLIADVIETQSHDVGKKTLMASTSYNAVLPQLCD